MSLHRSLKTKPAGLNQHRNVLTRAERLERLTENAQFDPSKHSPLGVVKVGNRQMVTKKKKKEEKEEGATPAAAEADAAAPAKKKPAGK